MPASINLADEVVSAHHRIAPHIRRTYLEHSRFYSHLTGANVYFKCENLQRTGSFKLRGALNKYMSLSLDEQQQGVVAASTGNHGKAVAFAARQFHGGCTIFAPNNADLSKLQAIRDMGAETQSVGADCVEAEAAARELAKHFGRKYISPYNDATVIAGQGTIGLEICEQLDHVDGVIGAMGGGGMIGGVASYVQSVHPDCRFVGCSPDNSKVMIESLAAGELLDLPSSETLSDGTAGSVEAGSMTFDLCQQLISQTVSVSEPEIADCLVQFIETHGMLIEGAAAVAIAALLRVDSEFVGKNVVVILCGANISLERLADVSKRGKQRRD